MNRTMNFRQSVVFALFAWSTATLAAEGFVAGLQPDRRPEGAPVMTGEQPDARLQAMAQQGIAEPRVGLGFLKDQGAWYTPFNRPNMPGRYDIRGLHAGSDTIKVNATKD